MAEIKINATERVIRRTEARTESFCRFFTFALGELFHGKGNNICG